MSEYIYFIRLNGFILSNQNIFKIGRCDNFYQRLNQYISLSEVYVIYRVKKSIQLENIIKKVFNIKFINEEIYGNEYFFGNPLEMIKEIDNIINTYEIVDKIDLFDIFINKKLSRHIIYNTPTFNSNIYNYIKNYCNTNNIINNTAMEYQHFYYKHFLQKKSISKKNINYLNNIELENYYNDIYNKNLNKKTNKKETNEEELNEEVNNEELNEESNEEVNNQEVNEKKSNKKEIDDKINEEVNQEVNQEINQEINEEKSNKKEIDDNTFYICHHCIKYKSIYKSDVKKHLNKKSKCKSYIENNLFKDSFDKSIGKSYTFLFNTNNLDINDYIFIIDKYTNINNIINKDFKNNELILENNERNCENIIKIKSKINDNIKAKFNCPDCNKEYTSKQNLLKHHENKSLCKQNQIYNLIINKNNRK